VVTPSRLDLAGVRGDALLIAVSLIIPGPPPRPLTTAEAEAIRATWPVMEMQVRLKAGDLGEPLLSLTSAAGQLSIVPAYPQPDGGTAPVLLIQAADDLTQLAMRGVYDIQFSGPGTGPYTWLAGVFKLRPDVTRAPA
jgi:hypothetical protein